MKNMTILNEWILAMLFAWLVACSTTISEPPQQTPSTTIVSERITPTFSPQPTLTGMTTSSHTSQTVTDTPTPMTVPTITATPTSLPIPHVVLLDNCPIIVTPDVFTFGSNGSVWFLKESALWLIANGSTSPTRVYTIPSEILSENLFWVYMVPGTTRILSYHGTPGNMTGYYSVYDLLSGQEIGVPILLDHLPVEGWLPDGRFILQRTAESIPDLGIKREFLIVDPVTQQTQIVSSDLDLPGYSYFHEPFYSGIASPDPTGSLVLYTLFNTAQDVFAIALLDRKTGARIWYQEVDPPPYPYAEPYWTADGGHVLFSLFILKGAEGYIQLVSLNRDGQIEQLPLQPLPLTYEWWWLKSLSYSPERRYIYYKLGEGMEKGPAIIVDLVTLEAREMCDPGTTFVDGEWISENQFVYRVAMDGMMSLRLLDVPSWTTQNLVDSEPDELSWTYIENP